MFATHCSSQNLFAFRQHIGGDSHRLTDSLQRRYATIVAWICWHSLFVSNQMWSLLRNKPGTEAVGIVISGQPQYPSHQSHKAFCVQSMTREILKVAGQAQILL